VDAGQHRGDETAQGRGKRRQAHPALDPGAGVLYALGEGSGRVFSRIAVGSTVRFATPALSGGLVLVPTRTGITAVSGG